MADLEYVVKDGIGTILLNRPEKKNAFTFAMIDEWAAALRSARTDPEGYIRVGLVPGDGGCYFPPRMVGMAKALELLWTGDFVDAEEALRLRIANHVYPDAGFAASWQEFARRLAEQPPVNVRMIKRAACQSARTDLRTALDLISSHMAVVNSTHDSAEAMSAFRERRAPLFEGH